MKINPAAMHPAAMPYLSAHWAIEPSAHLRVMNHLMALPPDADLSAYYFEGEDEDSGSSSRTTERKPKKPYLLASGIAVLPLVGVLQKAEDWFTRWYPDASTATGRFVLNLNQAAADSDVTGILLYVDSPGGLMDGTADAADAVYAVRQAGKKPITAFIDGMGCSAAYWIASQSTELLAGQTAFVGSIGTRWSLLDSSKAYEMMGLRPEEITSGTYKAAGAAGVPFTDEDRAYYQSIVNRCQVPFTAGVARGRKKPVDDIRQIAAEARVYVGKESQDIGLVDGIANVSDTLKQMQRATRSTTTTAAAAAIAAIVAATALGKKEQRI